MSTTGTQTPPRQSSRPLVLVAEDHDDTRTMLETMLTMSGFAVAPYGDGETALAETVRLDPDVVVLDGHLQGLDGCSVARGIRAHDRFRALPIVYVSGYSGEEVEERARAAGCDHYLLKPVDLEHLVMLVRRLTSVP